MAGAKALKIEDIYFIALRKFLVRNNYDLSKSLHLLFAPLSLLRDNDGSYIIKGNLIQGYINLFENILPGLVSIKLIPSEGKYLIIRYKVFVLI